MWLFESNVCAEAPPSGFQLYLGYATKAKVCVTLSPFLSLFSRPCPVVVASHEASVSRLQAFSLPPSLIPLIPIQVKMHFKKVTLKHCQCHLISVLVCSLWRKSVFGNDYSFQNDCRMFPTHWLSSDMMTLFWVTKPKSAVEKLNTGPSHPHTSSPCLQTGAHSLNGSCQVLCIMLMHSFSKQSLSACVPGTVQVLRT